MFVGYAPKILIQHLYSDKHAALNFKLKHQRRGSPPLVEYLLVSPSLNDGSWTEHYLKQFRHPNPPGVGVAG